MSGDTDGRPSELRPVARRSLLFVVGDAVDRGAGLLLLPVYARLLAPEEVGLVGLALVWSALLSLIGGLGATGVVSRFYFQFDDADERDRFLSTYWLLLVGLSVSLGVLALGIGPGLFSVALREVPWAPLGLLATALAVVRAPFMPVLLALLRIREQARLYVVVAGATSALTVGATVTAVTLSRSATSAITGLLLGSAVSALVAAVVLGREIGLRWSRHHVRPALRFAIPLLPHVSSHWVLSASDRVVLERYVPLADVGQYTLAYQGATALAAVFQAASQALLAPLSRAASDASEREGVPRLGTAFATAVLMLGTLAAAIGPDIALVVLGEAYRDAARIVPILVAGMVMIGLYQLPIQLLILVAGRPRAVAWATTVSAITNLAANLLLVPRFGLPAAAWSTVLAYALLTSLLARAAGRAVPDVRFPVRPFVVGLIGLSAVVASRVLGPEPGLAGAAVGSVVAAPVLGAIWWSYRQEAA